MTSPHNSMLGLTNSQAEVAVLHAMRDDTAAAIALSDQLEPGDFADNRHALIFEAIHNVLLGIEPIDTKAILAESLKLIRERNLKYQIDESYLDSLTEGDSRRYEMYGNTVKKLSWLRKAGDFAFWLAQELQGRPKPDALFTAAQERWQLLAPKQITNRFVYGWDTEEEHVALLRERLRRREQGVLSRFDWPWASWNNIIRPLQPGFVGVIGAADGVGKTTYLEMISEHWAKQGLQVVYVHLEDHLSYKMDRRLARHARIAIERLQDGTLDEEEGERIREARQYIDTFRGNIHYLDAAGESMSSILAELEVKVTEGVLDALIIDYIDKCAPSRGQVSLFASNVWERQANDMEQLKVFVSKHSKVALTATQGNKTLYGEGQQTRKGIAGSIQKSQKAQLVILLQRELMGENGKLDKAGNMIAGPGEYSPEVKVRVDKQNIGRTGQFKQVLKGQYFTVRDIQSEPMTPLLPEAVAPVRTPYKDD